MAPNTIAVAKCADCAQAARRLRVKRTRHRLVGRVAKCPQLRQPPTIEAIYRGQYFADVGYK